MSVTLAPSIYLSDKPPDPCEDIATNDALQGTLSTLSLAWPWFSVPTLHCFTLCCVVKEVAEAMPNIFYTHLLNGYLLLSIVHC